MTGTPDIRWKQRFQNFGRAFALLSDALVQGAEPLSALEKEGVIQRFEYTLELSWKTVKDYLEAQGQIVSPETPRQVLKEAFASGVIRDGQIWIRMLDHRNLLSHTYDQKVFAHAVDAIAAQYLSAIAELYTYLEATARE